MSKSKNKKFSKQVDALMEKLKKEHLEFKQAAQVYFEKRKTEVKTQ